MTAQESGTCCWVTGHKPAIVFKRRVRISFFSCLVPPGTCYFPPNICSLRPKTRWSSSGTPRRVRYDLPAQISLVSRCLIMCLGDTAMPRRTLETRLMSAIGGKADISHMRAQAC